MVERRLTGMIAAAAVLIVLFIFWDVFRPAPRPVEPGSTAPLRIAEPPPTPPPQNPPPPEATTPTTTSQGTAVPAGPNGREPSYLELMARSETRRRIRSSGSTTYIAEMLEASGDSMLRRGGNRPTQPLWGGVPPPHAPEYQTAVVGA